MSDASTFADFVRRIRQGDDLAAEELVHKDAPLIRREVRLSIEDDRLRRAFDSIDVCQSVLASFFVRVAVGQFELERPAQLAGLLVAMARNKIASRARFEQRLRRDSRRVSHPTEDTLDELIDPMPSPSETVTSRDLLDSLRAALTEEERHIADLRGRGLEWDEVALELGGTGQARRMQLTRAVERAGRKLGFAD